MIGARKKANALPNDIFNEIGQYLNEYMQNLDREVYSKVTQTVVEQVMDKGSMLNYLFSSFPTEVKTEFNKDAQTWELVVKKGEKEERHHLHADPFVLSTNRSYDYHDFRFGGSFDNQTYYVGKDYHADPLPETAYFQFTTQVLRQNTNQYKLLLPDGGWGNLDFIEDVIDWHFIRGVRGDNVDFVPMFTGHWSFDKQEKVIHIHQPEGINVGDYPKEFDPFLNGTYPNPVSTTNRRQKRHALQYWVHLTARVKVPKDKIVDPIHGYRFLNNPIHERL